MIPGQSYTITVGAGGAGCSSNLCTGGNGGFSSFDGIVTSNGGTGGGPNNVGIGGTSNALINCTGGTGYNNLTPGTVNCLNYYYGNGGGGVTTGTSATGANGLVIVYW